MSPSHTGVQTYLCRDVDAWAADLGKVLERLQWTRFKRDLDVSYSHAKQELHFAVRETAHETSLAVMQGRLQARRIFDAELTRLRHRLEVSE